MRFAMTLRRSIVTLATLFCVACTSLGTLDRNTPPPDLDHAIFIMGVAPPDARVSFFQGDVRDGTFFQNPLTPSSLYGNPTDGFLVGETHASKTLAITFVQLVRPGQIFGPVFSPCGKAKTITFTAPSGKIIYLASVKFDVALGYLVPHYSNTDLSGARAYLANHYPNLAGGIEQGQYEFLPSSKGCGPWG